MKKLNTLYRVDVGESKQIGGYVPIQLIGSPLSATIYGTEGEGISQQAIVLSDMAELAPDDSPFVRQGIENFTSIPSFIAIMGVGEGFQISNVSLKEIKSLV